MAALFLAATQHEKTAVHADFRNFRTGSADPFDSAVIRSL